MSQTTITNFEKDTRANILGSQPASDGKMAYATDTESLFFSNSGDWVETAVHKTISKQYTYPSSSVTVSKSPVIHLDASVTASVLNDQGVTASAGDVVSRWNGQVGMTDMVQDIASLQPVLSATEHGPAIKFQGINSMLSDSTHDQVYFGAFTIFLIFTPDDPINDTTGTVDGILKGCPLRGTNTSFIFAGKGDRDVFTGPETRMHSAGVNHYLYCGLPGADSSLNMGNSETIINKPGESGDGFTYREHLNRNFDQRSQIVVLRAAEPAYNTSHNVRVNIHSYHYFGGYAVGSSAGGHPTGIANGQYTHSANRQLAGLTMGLSKLYYGESSYAAVHELLIFNNDLPNSEINAIGAELAAKWQTGASGATKIQGNLPGDGVDLRPDWRPLR